MTRALRNRTATLVASLGFVLAACGVEDPPLGARIGLPTGSGAEVTITPAIADGAIEELGWGSRLVVEHVAIHLSDVRLLGADPRIPAGGLGLLDQPRVVGADGRPGAALHLPIPDRFVDTEDLAVFLRLEPSVELAGASVEVFGRLYASLPAEAEASRLTAGEDGRTGAPDPDVDPARDERSVDDGPDDAVPDPDVDPAHGDPSMDDERSGDVPDPDVDPAHEDSETADPGAPTGTRRQALTRSSDPGAPSVAFVLRDAAAADMVAILGPRSKLDVVVGIPAERWFDDRVVAELESALARGVDGQHVVRVRRTEDRLNPSAPDEATQEPWSDRVDRPEDADPALGRLPDEEVLTEGKGDGELFLAADRCVEGNRLK